MILFSSDIEIAAYVHSRKIEITVHRTILEESGLYQQQHYKSGSTAALNASGEAYYIFHIIHFVSADYQGGHFALLQYRNRDTLSTVVQVSD